MVYAPGEKEKYSNAAIGLVGFTLQKTQGEMFETYVQKKVLDPLGMKSSSFLPTPAVRKSLAEAVMWTYHGREFAAPTFELGEAPAGCMYSTVLDLAKFQSCLFADGKVGDKQLLKPETLAEMFRSQYAAGFGLGFRVSQLDGHKRIGHGGAVYGFATEFAALPVEKLGAVVVCSRDVSNAVTTRIANDALRFMLAAKARKPIPRLEATEPLSANEARGLVGRYRFGDKTVFELIESAGRLYYVPTNGGAILRLRKSGANLITDDPQSIGLKIGRMRERRLHARRADGSAAGMPGQVEGSDRRIWLGPQHALDLTNATVACTR